MAEAATKRFLNKKKALKLYNTKTVEDLDANILKTDTIADAVVDCFAKMPGGTGWAMVDEALANGIESIKNPPEEIVTLFESVDHVPDWVDWDQLERGAIAFWRPGFFTGLALQCASLAAGYQSSSAVMPLIITGRLVDRAEKRKEETSRWVLNASSPGGMKRSAEGFSYSVRVRLIHAFVRRKLMKMPEWDSQAWGTPINLTDTSYGISGEFSSVAIDAIQKCGIKYSDRERADIYALWRYVGYVIGIPEDLLPISEADALERMAIKDLTDTRADDNSRHLVSALIEHGGDDVEDLPFYLKSVVTQDRIVDFLYGQVRYFSGKLVADELGIPDTRWKYALRSLRPSVRFFDKHRRRFKSDKQRAEGMIQMAWHLLDDKKVSKELAGEESLTEDITKRRSLIKQNLTKSVA